MRIIEATPPPVQTERALPHKSFIAFDSPGTVGGRAFNCPNSRSYTFDMSERRVQQIRNTDAEYLLGKWPSIFKSV